MVQQNHHLERSEEPLTHIFRELGHSSFNFTLKIIVSPAVLGAFSLKPGPCTIFFLVHPVCNKKFCEISLMAYEIGHVVGFLSSLGTHLVRRLWKAVGSVLLVLKKWLFLHFRVKWTVTKTSYYFWLDHVKEEGSRILTRVWLKRSA